MKCKKIPLFFVLITTLFLSYSVFPAFATNYQWIQNPSFEQRINYAEDGSAESGSFLSGVTYGNFSYTGTSSFITTTTARTGTHSFCINYTGSSGYIWYNLSEPILGTDILEFSLYGYYSTGYHIHANIFYTDGTSSGDLEVSAPSAWNTKTDLTSSINDLKYVSYIIFSCGTNGNMYFDDVVILTNIGEYQDEITQTSNPWFMPYGGTVNMSTEFSKTGSYSVHANLNPYPTSFWNDLSYPPIAQSISGLDCSVVTAFNLWAYDESSNAYNTSIRAYVWFSDTTYDYKDVAFTSHNTWQLFNFLSVITDNPDKTIISIGFLQINTLGYGYVWFDEVSLTATIPYSSALFTFTLVPAPLSYNIGSVTGYEFRAYATSNYVFTGILSDRTNGTFTVNSDFDVGSGVVSNGTFAFNILSRYSQGLRMDYQEQFLIQIDDGTTIKVYSVIADWVIPASTDNKTPTEKTEQFTNALPIMIIFAIFIIPATYYLGVGGFIGGFSVASIVCAWTGLAPTWILAITILTDLVMIFFATRQSSPKGTGG